MKQTQQSKIYDSRVRTLANWEWGTKRVVTIYRDSKYETAIRHHLYDEGGSLVVAEIYDTSEEAIHGHGWWVDKVKRNCLPKMSVLPIGNKSQDIAITYKAIVRIFANFATKENKIKVKVLNNRPGCMFVTINAGQYRGSLLYDTTKKVAQNVSPFWREIIEQERALAQDRAESKEPL